MEYASGNIFIRDMHLKKGEVVRGHTHNFDHTSYVPKGSVLIEKEGASIEKHAGSWVLIKANETHRITALEDAVVHCIYSHRNPQGEIVQEYDGWTESYV